MHLHRDFGQYSSNNLYLPYRCLVVAGGVAANQAVRTALQGVAETAGMRLVCPPPRLCTDNGVMVAWAGAERLALGLIEPPQPRQTISGRDTLPERVFVSDPAGLPLAEADGGVVITMSVPVEGGQVGGSGDGRCDGHRSGGEGVSSSPSTEIGVVSVAGSDEAAAQQLADSSQRCQKLWEDDEWVELRPRWPLTNKVDERSISTVKDRARPRGMRTKRLHRSLTELTADALATLSGVETSGGAVPLVLDARVEQTLVP